MPVPDDASEFIDSDFQSARQAAYPAPASDASHLPNRPPTREEIEAMVSEKQIKLAELKRAQEELERERATLEEMRRRQMEFQTGRAEILQHLTRGVGLLEEAELNARRDAEQMSRALAGFRDALDKVQAINEQHWSQETVAIELTRALTTLENARMEWNSARLKFPVLGNNDNTSGDAESVSPKGRPSLFGRASLVEICKIGFALNWPLVLVGAAIFIALLLRR